MSFLNKYPYSDFHELNLDWIIKRMQELGIKVDEFMALNEITFAGAWSIANSYGRWVVVTDNDKGYISLQPVPAGISINDSSYWSVIMNMQELVVMKKHIYIFGGDSYSVENYGHTGWMDLVAANMGLTNGVDVFDARNLVGYYGGSFAAGTFLTQLQALYANLNNPEDITDICYFAGTNEVTHTDAEIWTGISDFMTYAKEHFPNARVIIGFIGGTQASSNWADFQRACRVYRKAIELGAEYCDNIEYVNQRYDDYYDTLHPNDYTEMARYIANGILHGSVSVSREVTVKSADETVQFVFDQKDKTISVRSFLPNPSPVAIPPHHLQGQTAISSLDVTACPFVKEDITIEVPCAWQDASNTFHSNNMLVTISPNGGVKISIESYPDMTGIPINKTMTCTPYVWNTFQLKLN